MFQALLLLAIPHEQHSKSLRYCDVFMLLLYKYDIAGAPMCPSCCRSNTLNVHHTPTGANTYLAV